MERTKTHLLTGDVEQNANGNEYDANGKEGWEHGFRGENGLPGLQPLLLEGCVWRLL